MAEGENNIPPETTPEESGYKVVEAPPDPNVEESLDAVRFYGSKKWHEVMGNLHKPGHRTHNSARGRTYPRRTRKI